MMDKTDRCEFDHVMIKPRGTVVLRRDAVRSLTSMAAQVKAMFAEVLSNGSIPERMRECRNQVNLYWLVSDAALQRKQSFP